MNTWISIKDKLPPVEEWVLFYDGEHTMQGELRYTIDKIDKQGHCFVCYLHNYTHWMQLSRPELEN
jgi:hypothetical protein